VRSIAKERERGRKVEKVRHKAKEREKGRE
jgi:hypothetical protein